MLKLDLKLHMDQLGSGLVVRITLVAYYLWGKRQRKMHTTKHEKCLFIFQTNLQKDYFSNMHCGLGKKANIFQIDAKMLTNYAYFDNVVSFDNASFLVLAPQFGRRAANARVATARQRQHRTSRRSVACILSGASYQVHKPFLMHNAQMKHQLLICYPTNDTQIAKQPSHTLHGSSWDFSKPISPPFLLHVDQKQLASHVCQS